MDGELVRKFEMPIDYTVSGDDEEVLRSNVRSLEAFLKTDKPGPVAKYRVYGLMNCNPWIQVPGWGDGKLSDDTHLSRQELSADHIKTKHMQVGIAVFTGTGQRIGEAT